MTSTTTTVARMMPVVVLVQMLHFTNCFRDNSLALAFPLSSSKCIRQDCIRLSGGGRRSPPSPRIVSTAAAQSPSPARDTTQLDQLLDSAGRYEQAGPIIKVFQSGRGQLWRRFRGTLLEITWKPVLLNTLYALGVCYLMRYQLAAGGVATWKIGEVPEMDALPVLKLLAACSKFWHYLLTLTTFTLTFFLNNAFAMWKTCYTLSTSIQGRLNDICLLAATHAERDKRTGRLTAEAEAIVTKLGRYSRMFHLLYYASIKQSHKAVLSDAGMAALVERQELTQEEITIMKDLGADCPPHYILYTWMYSIFKQEFDKGKEGLLRGDGGYEGVWLTKFHDLRGHFIAIGGTIAARMPLAYAHFVQILVDLFLILVPLALYPEMGAWAVLATAALTTFYHGLLDLAKLLLDPYGNEQGCGQFVVDTWLAQSNAASKRWLKIVNALPGAN